ncbi:hypothetical protein HMN09_01054000 [Mycena chlorophos]|uniref:Uncharacterized protein n=1 Tax=Mycena chlorophos TaxID=658473 RepID=A0A8H6SD14_MYCCL|nr:hypothetical protein HMN09_01054000 [Mycena chlorophos]
MADAELPSAADPSPTNSNRLTLDQILELLTPDELLELGHATGRDGDLNRQDDTLWPVSMDAVLILGLVAFESEYGSVVNETSNSQLVHRGEYLSRYLQSHTGIYRSLGQVRARVRALSFSKHAGLRSLIARRGPISTMGLPSWMTRFSTFNSFNSSQPYGCLRVESVKARYMRDDHGVLNVVSPQELANTLPDRLLVTKLSADVPSIVLLASPILLSGENTVSGVPHGGQDTIAPTPFQAGVELAGRGFMLRDRWCYLIELMAAKDDLALSPEWVVTLVLRGKVEIEPGVRYAIELRYHVTNLYLQPDPAWSHRIPRNPMPPFDDGSDLIQRYAFQSGILLPNVGLSNIQIQPLSFMARPSARRKNIPLEDRVHVPDPSALLVPGPSQHALTSYASRTSFTGMFKLNEYTGTTRTSAPAAASASQARPMTFIQESGRDKKRKRS